MSAKKCNLCGTEMMTRAVQTPSGVGMLVAVCRKCDRRQCAACKTHEQDVFARRCTKCAVPY